MTGMDVREFNKQLVEQFRADGGVGSLGPVHFERILLLTTTGRRTGNPHTVPLGFIRSSGDGGDDGGGEGGSQDYVVFAANAASRVPPAWYFNLIQDPEVVIEVGAERLAATASESLGAQRESDYAAWVATFPNTANYQEQAHRAIPLVHLRPH